MLAVHHKSRTRPYPPKARTTPPSPANPFPLSPFSLRLCAGISVTLPCAFVLAHTDDSREANSKTRRSKARKGKRRETGQGGKEKCKNQSPALVCQLVCHGWKGCWCDCRPRTQNSLLSLLLLNLNGKLCPPAKYTFSQFASNQLTYTHTHSLLGWWCYCNKTFPTLCPSSRFVPATSGASTARAYVCVKFLCHQISIPFLFPTSSSNAV